MTPETAWICAWIGQPGYPPPPGLDSGRLAATLRHHRLAAALAGPMAARFAEGGGDPGPLPGLARRAGLAGLRRAAMLARIATAAAGLPLVAVKGPAFAARLLGDPVRRDGRDLDLLTTPSATAAMLKLLAGLGYQPRPGQPPLDAAPSIELTAAEPGAPLIELHRHLAPDPALFPLAVLDPFRRAVPAMIGTVAVPTLADEDAVIFAAYHGMRHAWARLFWLADIAAVMRAPPAAFDWARAAARAATLGCRDHLDCALILAQTLFAIPLPADPHPGRLARWAAASFRPVFAGAPVIDRAAMHRVGMLRYIALDLAMQRAPGGRRALLIQHLRPTARDRAWVRLPPWAGWVYWLIRPLRLVLERRG